jgi:hypothetical protein
MVMLAALAALAPPPLAASAAPPRPAAKKRWESCRLRVANKTPYRVLVHVDGVYWGWVNAQQRFTFTGIPEGRIVAYGTTQFGERYWGPQPLKCAGEASWELSF